MQPGQVFPDTRALFIPEVDIAVQPPVGDIVQVVVAQFDRAACRKHRRQGREADNPAKS
jgi:hypothetical protein